MTRFRFVHAADIHLDSPLIGLGSRTDAPIERVRGATREALKNIVQLAIDEQAAFVVIAGDLYDGSWRDMKTGIFAMQQLSRLSHAGIPTFVTLGNHDAESKITADLPRPDGVHFFGSAAGEVVVLDDLGVAVHGRSFRTAAVTDNLASGYARPVDGMFNVALLHTALEGGHEHANYAPCTLAELRLSGHDYWALGHVHDHAVHCEHPHVVYPGNCQGRSVRETGPKGVVVVDVDEREVTSLRHVVVDDVRWDALTITVEEGRGAELHDLFRDALDAAVAIADGRPLIARVTIDVAGTDADRLAAGMDMVDAELRALAAQTSSEVWLEKIKLRVRGAGSVELPGELADLLAGAAADAGALAAVEAALKPLAEKLPQRVSEADDLVRSLQDGDWGALASVATATVAARAGRRA